MCGRVFPFEFLSETRKPNHWILLLESQTYMHVAMRRDRGAVRPVSVSFLPVWIQVESMDTSCARSAYCDWHMTLTLMTLVKTMPSCFFHLCPHLSPIDFSSGITNDHHFERVILTCTRKRRSSLLQRVGRVISSNQPTNQPTS